jgi:putative protein-disulfide isomerase
MENKLHLIVDPLCGWCFGAEPLISAARQITHLDIVLHCGGLFSGPNSQHLDPGMRQYILSHHERILKLTGQDVGENFYTLLDSGKAMLDSSPPIQGIMAAEAAARGTSLDFYQALIRAHFIDGRPVTETNTLQALAEECGIDSKHFSQAFAELDESAISAHILATRQLMQEVGSQGFPSFVLEQDAHMSMINHYQFYKDASAWQKRLQEELARSQEQIIH